MTIATRYPQILTVAAAMFARRGFHQASTRDIARAVGLSLAGLYHYVGGKDELLFLVLDRALDTLLAEPRRAEIAGKRQAYVQRGLRILRRLDRHDRSGDELLSATNLLLGMLNGIGRRPFVRSSEDAGALASQVGALFLYGFLERSDVGELSVDAHGDRHGD